MLINRIKAKFFLKHLRHNSTLHPTTDHVYCMNLVRRGDHESYLGTLLLSNHLRNAGFVLRAFQIEIAQIRDIVSDKRIGLMRLQFWRDAIEKVFKKEVLPSSPVVFELNKIVQNHDLKKMWLSRILDAREDQIISDLPFSSIEHAEKHAENVHSSLFYLLLQCAGVNSVKADHVASHLGKAQGLVTLLRALPYHASKRIVYMPIDIMMRHQLSQEDIIRRSEEQKLKDVSYEIASQANSHIDKALSHWHEIPNEAKIIFLSATPTKLYLKSIQRVDFNPFDARLQGRNNWLPMVLFLNKLRKKF